MRKGIAAALLTLLSSTTLFATWAMIPLEELVAKSDLIIIGTLHSASEDETGIGRGRILVDAIVSGNARTLDGRPLQLGDNLRINWADNWACAAGMHQGRIGKQGIWLLDVQQDGTVLAAYPGKFRELEDHAEIRQILLRNKIKRFSVLDTSAEQASESEVITSVAPSSPSVVDVSSYPDYSLARAAIVLLLATGLYLILYRGRFRIR
jgi:hypothetical protein